MTLINTWYLIDKRFNCSGLTHLWAWFSDFPDINRALTLATIFHMKLYSSNFTSYIFGSEYPIMGYWRYLVAFLMFDLMLNFMFHSCFLDLLLIFFLPTFRKLFVWMSLWIPFLSSFIMIYLSTLIRFSMWFGQLLKSKFD